MFWNPEGLLCIRFQPGEKKMVVGAILPGVIALKMIVVVVLYLEVSEGPGGFRKESQRGS